MASHQEKSIPEVVTGCLHAPVPGRRRAKARGSDREVELEGTLSALCPGRELLRPRGWPGRHHAAPAERCRRPGHRHHPRSDLWYVSTPPRLRPASAVPASVLHLRDPEISLPSPFLLPAIQESFPRLEGRREGASCCPSSFLLLSRSLTHGSGRAVRNRTLQHPKNVP